MRLLQWFPEREVVRLDHASERFFPRGDDYHGNRLYGTSLLCNNEPPMLSIGQLMRFTSHYRFYQPPAALDWQAVVEPRKKTKGKAHARIRRVLGQAGKTLQRCIGAVPSYADYYANPYAFVLDAMAEDEEDQEPILLPPFQVYPFV